VRLTWDEIRKIEASWKSDDGPASKDVSALIKHIRFIEHLLEASEKVGLRQMGQSKKKIQEHLKKARELAENSKSEYLLTLLGAINPEKITQAEKQFILSVIEQAGVCL